MTDVNETILGPFEGFLFGGDGTVADIGAARWAEALSTLRDAGFAWLHLQRMQEGTDAILRDLKLDRFVIEALTAEETRPRCTVHENGVILNLRGVNLNPDAQPEDMVSVRFWITGRLVVGVWNRPLQAVGDVVDGLRRGNAPATSGDLIARIALRLADRAEPTVAALNAAIDTFEEAMLDGGARTVDGPGLANIRRSTIVLRRYLVPQRDALTTLEIEDLDWLTERGRARIREAADRITRFGEELDAIRDRAQVVHDQIVEHRAEGMNDRMLVLAVVAAVFLPLGLITGLLGINVGGIPGATTPWAFWAVCVLLIAVAAGLVWWFRRANMFR